MNVKEYRHQMELQGRSGTVAALTAAGAQSPSSSQAAWAQALDRLADPALESAVRKSAFQVLQAGSFLGPEFAPAHARFMQMLRDLARDRDADLRRMALDALTNLKDNFARQVLTRGLQGTGPALVPPAVALGFLARDDHGATHGIARDLLANSADIHVREQAARILGGDPAAKSLLSNAMMDKAEFRQVRRASAVALRGLDPKMFTHSAQDILNDVDDFEDIKATVAGALARASEPVVGERPPPAPVPPATKKTLRRPGL